MNNKNWYRKQLYTIDGYLILAADFGIEHRNYKNIDSSNFWLQGQNKIFVKQSIGINDIDAEVLYSVLAKHFGLSVVDVYPALMLYKKGRAYEHVLIDSFVEKDTQKIYSGESILKFYRRVNNIQFKTSHSEDTYKKAFEKRKEHYLNNKGAKKYTIDKDIDRQFFLLTLIDLLTLNNDRHPNNIAFLESEYHKNYKLKLAQAYDNSTAFKLVQFNSFNITNFEDWIEYTIEGTFFPFSLENNLYGVNFDKLSSELAQKIAQNKEFEKIYNEIVKFDFSQLQNMITERFNGYKVPQEKFEFANKVFNKTQQELKIKVNQTKEKLIKPFRIEAEL